MKEATSADQKQSMVHHPCVPSCALGLTIKSVDCRHWRSQAHANDWELVGLGSELNSEINQVWSRVCDLARSYWLRLGTLVLAPAWHARTGSDLAPGRPGRPGRAVAAAPTGLLRRGLGMFNAQNYIFHSRTGEDSGIAPLQVDCLIKHRHLKDFQSQSKKNQLGSSRQQNSQLQDDAQR